MLCLVSHPSVGRRTRKASLRVFRRRELFASSRAARRARLHRSARSARTPGQGERQVGGRALAPALQQCRRRLPGGQNSRSRARTRRRSRRKILRRKQSRARPRRLRSLPCCRAFSAARSPCTRSPDACSSAAWPRTSPRLIVVGRQSSAAHVPFHRAGESHGRHRTGRAAHDVYSRTAWSRPPRRRSPSATRSFRRPFTARATARRWSR